MITQVLRCFTGGGQQGQRTAESLADQHLGLLGREAQADRGLLISGDVFEEEARATAGDGRNGVEHGLRDFHGGSEAGEDRGDDRGVGLAQRLGRTERRDPLPHRTRRVGHGTGDGPGAREEAREAFAAGAGEDRDDEFTGGWRTERRVKREEDLRLAGHHDGIRALHEVGGGGREAYAGLLGKFLGADASTPEDGDVRGTACPRAEQATHHGACHATGSDEGELRHDQRVRIAASRTVQAWSMSLPSWAVDKNAVS